MLSYGMMKIKNLYVIKQRDFTILNLSHKIPYNRLKKEKNSTVETNLDSVLNLVQRIMGLIWVNLF